MYTTETNFKWPGIRLENKKCLSSYYKSIQRTEERYGQVTTTKNMFKM